jgi:hypothetical protein
MACPIWVPYFAASTVSGQVSHVDARCAPAAGLHVRADAIQHREQCRELAMAVCHVGVRQPGLWTTILCRPPSHTGGDATQGGGHVPFRPDEG